MKSDSDALDVRQREVDLAEAKAQSNIAKSEAIISEALSTKAKARNMIKSVTDYAEKTKQIRCEVQADRVQLKEQISNQDQYINEAISAGIEAGIKAAARAVVGLFNGDTKRCINKNWKHSDDKDLAVIWPIIQPTLDKLADWWEKFSRKVRLLPEPDQPQNAPFALDYQSDLSDGRDNDGLSM